MNVRRGDVVLVLYPFASSRGASRRPALVVQNNRDIGVWTIRLESVQIWIEMIYCLRHPRTLRRQYDSLQKLPAKQYSQKRLCA
jgi:hypothetical protein